MTQDQKDTMKVMIFGTAIGVISFLAFRQLVEAGKA